MSKVNIGQFIQQVRQETSKVTWPTRKETAITTGMVFLMVFAAALFFFLADQLISLGLRQLLRIGG
jgi:preprotein translocase subunit SecE